MRRDHLNALRGVAEVRTLQRLKAEAEVGRVVAEVAELQAKSAAASGQLALDQEGWEAGLTARSVDLQQLSAWADAVQRTLSAFEQTVEEIGLVKKTEATARQSWSRASALADAAADLVRNAHRDLQRARDEQAMDEAADRAVQGRSQP